MSACSILCADVCTQYGIAQRSLLGDDGCRLCLCANTHHINGVGNIVTCSKKLLEKSIILRQ